MAHTVRLTSKRQATLPVNVCKELGLKPGDEIILEKQKVDGDILWILRPKVQHPPHWFGRLREYAQDKNHDMETIRNCIGSRLGLEK